MAPCLIPPITRYPHHLSFSTHSRYSLLYLSTRSIYKGKASATANRKALTRHLYDEEGWEQEPEDVGTSHNNTLRVHRTRPTKDDMMFAERRHSEEEREERGERKSRRDMTDNGNDSLITTRQDRGMNQSTDRMRPPPRHTYVSKRIREYERMVETCVKEAPIDEKIYNSHKLGDLRKALQGVNFNIIKKKGLLTNFEPGHLETMTQSYKMLQSLMGAENAQQAVSHDLNILHKWDAHKVKTKMDVLKHLLLPSSKESTDINDRIRCGMNDDLPMAGAVANNEKNRLYHSRDSNLEGANRNGDDKRSKKNKSGKRNETRPTPTPRTPSDIIGKLLARHRSLMNRDSKAMGETIKKLSGTFPEADVRGIVLAHPKFLLHDYKTLVLPAIRHLANLLPKANKATMFQEAPPLFYQKTEEIQKNYNALGRTLGLFALEGGEVILQYVAEQAPRLLFQDFALTSTRLKNLMIVLSFIKPDTVLSHMIPKCPSLSLLDPKMAIERNLNDLRQIYPDLDMVTNMVTDEPALLAIRRVNGFVSITHRYETLSSHLSLIENNEPNRPVKQRATFKRKTSDQTNDMIRKWIHRHPSSLLRYEPTNGYEDIKVIYRHGYMYKAVNDSKGLVEIELNGHPLEDVLRMNAREREEKFPKLEKAIR